MKVSQIWLSLQSNVCQNPAKDIESWISTSFNHSRHFSINMTLENTCSSDNKVLSVYRILESWGAFYDRLIGADKKRSK